MLRSHGLSRHCLRHRHLRLASTLPKELPRPRGKGRPRKNAPPPLNGPLALKTESSRSIFSWLFTPDQRAVSTRPTKAEKEQKKEEVISLEVRRPRGRPRKAQSEANEPTIAALSTTESASKRRGRKPTVKQEAEPKEAPGPNDVRPTKRARGRPRKTDMVTQVRLGRIQITPSRRRISQR